MNAREACGIVSLPLSTKEVSSTSRKRTGYNVYVSWFFFDFKALQQEREKERILVLAGVWAPPVLSCMSDEDSTRTPVSYGACHIMMAAARHWHRLSESVKTAWRRRAVRLNSMPVPGRFRSFPREVSKKPKIVGNRVLEQLIFDSLADDWGMVCKIMRSAMYRKARVVDSQTTFCFGKESVVMQNQVYRKFHLNRLLNAVLFGCKYEKLHPKFEVIYSKKKEALVHFASRRRMVEIFSVNGLGACMQKRNGVLYTCVTKICLIDYVGRIMMGYVIDEDDIDLIVMLEDDTFITIARPTFDINRGSYIFDSIRDGEYSIRQYWPIRFKMHVSGSTCFTLNRVVMKDNKLSKSNL